MSASVHGSFSILRLRSMTTVKSDLGFYDFFMKSCSKVISP